MYPCPCSVVSAANSQVQSFPPVRLEKVVCVCICSRVFEFLCARARARACACICFVVATLVSSLLHDSGPQVDASRSGMKARVLSAFKDRMENVRVHLRTLACVCVRV